MSHLFLLPYKAKFRVLDAAQARCHLGANQSPYTYAAPRDGRTTVPKDILRRVGEASYGLTVNGLEKCEEIYHPSRK
jgi:hypothetical protein